MRKHVIFPALAATAVVVAFAFAGGDPGGAVVRGPDLTTARMGHKIATLPLGDVLVVGGRGAGGVGLTTGETWHPGTVAWTPMDAAAEHLDECAIVRLSNGKYLVAGGADDGGQSPQSSAASIFDPDTNAFTPTTNMTYRRSRFSGAQLAGGKVLFAGGWDGVGGATLYGEIYDPTTWSFSNPTGWMDVDRAGPLVLACDDGTGLVVGGTAPISGVGLESVESYDPGSNLFTFVSDRILPGDGGWLVFGSTRSPRPIADQRMPDGKDLLFASRPKAGGAEQTLLAFDPATKAFAPFATTPALPTQAAFVFGQQPVIDPAKNVAYLVGQVAGTTADFAVYAVDLATHALAVPPGGYHLPSVYYPRNAAATLLADGRIALAGGMSGATDAGAIATTFLVTPGAWTPPAPPSGQFLLPTKITRKLNKDPAKAVMTVVATLDTGPDPAAFAASATFSMSVLSVPIAGLLPDRKGVLRASGDGYAISIVPGAAGGSRCKLTATLRGTKALAAGAYESVSLSMSCGNVSADGGCTLSNGAFKLGRGELPAGTSVPSSAKATLLGGGRDSFSVKWVIPRGTPVLPFPDIVFQFGATYAKTIPGAYFKQKGAVFSFRDRTNALPSMSIDFATGFITVTGKRTDLGTFAEGAQPVRFLAGPAGDQSFVDVRMVRKGRTLKY